VDLTSPVAGRVVTLHAREGEAVPVGAPLVTFETPEDALG
jgi:pyruvate/2-oxoglutarate dehydrogenase complex dihydrolipoamide acyltransferase (E2) component